MRLHLICLTCCRQVFNAAGLAVGYMSQNCPRGSCSITHDLFEACGLYVPFKTIMLQSTGVDWYLFRPAGHLLHSHPTLQHHLLPHDFCYFLPSPMWRSLVTGICRLQLFPLKPIGWPLNTSFLQWCWFIFRCSSVRMVI